MSTENLVGRTLAGYHLATYIGEGGTATVYKATHPEKGLAAVKVLKARTAQDPTNVKRFLREAEFGARVDHANIVKTYDWGEADGRHYLAMQWVEGESLSNFAVRAGTVAPPVVATIVEQIGTALAAVHAAGLVHRDLKPANIMYDPATQRACLLDFGIARDTESAGEDRLTRAGFFVGSLQYVAPEALSGELVGPQADVYSLATITYQLLTGELPFPGKTPRELFNQLLSQAPTPLNQAVKGLKFDPAVEQVVMRGLERDLKRRTPAIDVFTRDFCTAVREGGTRKGGFLSGLLSKFGG
jgi:serine/threonine-protein kinase